MVHANCTELLDLLEQYKIAIEDLTTELMVYKQEGNIEALCPKCNGLIEDGDLCFEAIEVFEDFEEAALEAIADALSDFIEACSYCDGSQLEYYTDRYNKEFEEDDLHIADSGIDAYDFISDAGIPEEYHEKILENLQCKNCGHGKEPFHSKHNPDGGSFSFDDRFYTRNEIDKFYGIDYEELQRFGTYYGITIDEGDFEEFRDFIYKYPLLAFKHDTGQKIYNIIKKSYEDTENKYYLSANAVIYRGRVRDNDKKKFKEDDMWSPPEGNATHGRYNSVGVSVLYCADKMEGIPYELRPVEGQVIDILSIKVKTDLVLLNVSKLFRDFNGFFSERNAESKLLKKSYLLTNFIRDCCHDIGYNGVVYAAVSKQKHTNYALFNVKRDIELGIVGEVQSCEYEVIYIRKEEEYGF